MDFSHTELGEPMPSGGGQAPSADGGAPAQGGGGGDAATGGQGGAGGGVESPQFVCINEAEGATLRNPANVPVAHYTSLSECQQALDDRGEGVVCVWFTPTMPVGPGGWKETGWRPMNIETGIGLGRQPLDSFEDCRAATRNARGGVVCTNTGIGFKAAHIGTNKWCGASSGLDYCLKATLAAKNHYVCSFPSEGQGPGVKWILTHIDGNTCHYLSSKMTIDDCNAKVPNP